MSQPSTRDLLRQIPPVDQLLLRPGIAQWVGRTSRRFIVSEIQSMLQEVRNGIRSGDDSWSSATEGSVLETLLDERLRERLRPVLVPVINATGVILHTNLGRAPLCAAARDNLSTVSAQYTNLEFDLSSGARSHRDLVLEGLLREILGCEAATIVNNNAAAVFLILNTLAQGREVVVSRGELIEIGGSFRIPDILARSGAFLREVGTTNKTRIQDYEDAIGSETSVLLRVHPSNYRMKGFTQRPALNEMVDLSRRLGIPLVEDLGSGCLIDLSPLGIVDEPLAQASISAGVDIVSFSGDKLLGGPQAGIIAGARKWIDLIRRNPLMRTYRVEKLIYGALEATLESYRTGRALPDVPVLRMLTMTAEEVARRCRGLIRRLKSRLPEGVRVRAVPGSSVVGGGSCPELGLPTTLLAIESDRHTPNALEFRLRSQHPPIILRIEENRALIDLRTVLPEQEEPLRDGLVSALS